MHKEAAPKARASREGVTSSPDFAVQYGFLPIVALRRMRDARSNMPPRHVGFALNLEREMACGNCDDVGQKYTRPPACASSHKSASQSNGAACRRDADKARLPSVLISRSLTFPCN